jgi:hypothetical protein
MLGISKRCSPRPKARDVLLTWARASACEDRAVEYLKLADVAPDRNVRNRFIAIARHNRTLAQIERCVARETSPQNHQSQSTIDQNRSRSLTSFAFVLLLIISGATIFAPFDFGRASDCLPGPNSPAPKGSHWYYHLDRSTQQKCWYVRSSEKQPRHATAQTTSADPAVPSTSAGQIGSAVTSGIDVPSGQLEPSTNPIQDPAFNTVPNRSAPQTAPQENIQPLALRGNASSDASGPAIATTAVVWPDPPPLAPSVTPREANAGAVDAPTNPVSDTTDSAVRNDERTSKFEIPIIIFPALAIGLVVVGFGARLIMKDSAARRAQTVDHTEAVTISDEDHPGSSANRRADESTGLGEDDFQSFVSAVSGYAPSDSTIGSVQLTNEISRREAKLARLREDIDRRLRWSEPVYERPPKQKVAC